MYSILKSWLTAGRLTVPASELALSEATVVRLEQLEALSKSYRKALSRSVMIRHLDAGSCNAEEAELLALANPVYDMSRFGLEITASPRHADILTVSGPVALQLLPAIKQTYDAMPEPKLVVAVGDGACYGTPYDTTYACLGPIDKFLPVSVYIGGDPPSPSDILAGLIECQKQLSSLN